MNVLIYVIYRTLIKVVLGTILFAVSGADLVAQMRNDTNLIVCELPAYSGGPEFVGSGRNLEHYVYQNLLYPPKAKRKKTTGIVTASFVIEKDGTINNIIILKSLPNGCDDAVVSLIKRMPKWRPAVNAGKPIRYVYELNVKFGGAYINAKD